MLTVKQEKYVQELLKGKSQREAYKIAYPSSRKWKDNVVDVRACELLKHSKVSVRYAKLREEREAEHKAKALYTLEEAVTDLKGIKELAYKDILQNGFRQANSTAFINAAKELIELEALGKEREVKLDLDTARIEKIKSETNSVENTENKLKDYFEALEGVLNDTK